MIKYKKVIIVLLIGILILAIIGCKQNNTIIPPDRATNDVNQSNETSEKQEYFKMLSEKSKHYLSDIPLDTQYDLAKVDIDKIESEEKFLTDFKNSYVDLEIRLKAFKEDLQNGVKTNDNVIVKVNNDIIASIDKNLDEINKFYIKLEEKNSSLSSKEKNVFLKALKKIERSPHKIRVELYRLIENSKMNLGL
ncbi:MAG: hypothetical protein ACRC7R_09870 [Sarcina sp.]